MDEIEPVPDWAYDDRKIRSIPKVAFTRKADVGVAWHVVIRAARAVLFSTLAMVISLISLGLALWGLSR